MRSARLGTELRDEIFVKHQAIVRICGRLSTSADPDRPFRGAVSSFADMTFTERLQKAAAHAQVKWGQTDVARSLGLSKQTVDRWFKGGEPKPAQLYLIADKWGVDPRWLATEHGQMLPAPVATGLEPLEEQLIAQYRRADPRWQLSVRLLAGLAVEEQLLAATDVNVVVARILRMRPQDLRYPSDAEIKDKLGLPPPAAERERHALRVQEGAGTHYRTKRVLKK